jgi:hypothetical protein
VPVIVARPRGGAGRHHPPVPAGATMAAKTHQPTHTSTSRPGRYRPHVRSPAR